MMAKKKTIPSKRGGKRAETANGIEILHRRYYQGRPERIAALDEARANDAIGRQIYQMRTDAGLSQRELADMVGTTASVISRLESADYEKHTLTMIRRIAAALNRRVKVEFVSAAEKT
jgi:ribosome-binding protein aMBF1 (putative translation factor)